MNNIKKITKMQLFLPIFSMILVMLVNVIYDVANGNAPFNFFTISTQLTSSGNTILYGRLIDILNRGSEVAILAIGMTLVVSASAGTDISVGSVMSLSGGMCCMLLAGYGVTNVSERLIKMKNLATAAQQTAKQRTLPFKVRRSHIIKLPDLLPDHNQALHKVLMSSIISLATHHQ